MKLTVSSTSHIAKVQIIPVCELCDKPSEITLDVMDLTMPRKGLFTAAKCDKCGGSISGQYGYCVACAKVKM